jgi:hypothetical protein
MCKQEMVSYYVWLRRRISSLAVCPEWVRAAARRLEAGVVAADGFYVWLVDGDPVLHPVTETLEAHACVSGVILAATHARSYNS